MQSGQKNREINFPASMHGDDAIGAMMQELSRPGYPVIETSTREGRTAPVYNNYGSSFLPRASSLDSRGISEQHAIQERRTMSLDASVHSQLSIQRETENLQWTERELKPEGYPDSGNGEGQASTKTKKSRMNFLSGTRSIRARGTTMPSPNRIEQEPVKRALVIMQGNFSEADEVNVYACLNRIGFQNRQVILRKEERIPKEEAEGYLLQFNQGLTPGSNLLLIAASFSQTGIGLSDTFLAEKFYRPIANFNKEMATACSKAMKRHKGNGFDARPYEGVTLHVVLDGVKGCTLPYALSFQVDQKSEIDLLRANWKKVPRSKEADFADLSAKAGRIFQICSDYRCAKLGAGAIFSAFVSTMLTECYLPYNIFALRVLSGAHYRFPGLFGSQNSNGPDQRSLVKSRSIGELAPLTIEMMVILSLKHVKQLVDKRTERTLETMIATGETVFSSLTEFDPNCSLDFKWNLH